MTMRAQHTQNAPPLLFETATHMVTHMPLGTCWPRLSASPYDPHAQLDMLTGTRFIAGDPYATWDMLAKTDGPCHGISLPAICSISIHEATSHRNQYYDCYIIQILAEILVVDCNEAIPGQQQEHM